MQLITDLKRIYFSFQTPSFLIDLTISVESGSSDLDTSINCVTVGSGLVGDWVKNVDSLWVTKELGLDELWLKTISCWFLLLWLTLWEWLLDSDVWLIVVLWCFIGSPVSGWVDHSLYGNVNIWSNLFIGDVTLLGKRPWFGSIAVIVVWFLSSGPVKSLNFVVDEIIDVWLNSWLGDITGFLLGESLRWWSVGPSVNWVGGVSSGELWDWHHVLVSSNESNNFLIDVLVRDIL